MGKSDSGNLAPKLRFGGWISMLCILGAVIMVYLLRSGITSTENERLLLVFFLLGFLGILVLCVMGLIHAVWRSRLS